MYHVVRQAYHHICIIVNNLKLKGNFMYIRCAYFEGTIKNSDKATFKHHVITEMVPLIQQFPGLIELRVNWDVWVENNAPPIILKLEMVFNSLEDIETALNSKIRAQNKIKSAQIMPLLKGRVFHINHSCTVYKASND